MKKNLVLTIDSKERNVGESIIIDINKTNEIDIILEFNIEKAFKYSIEYLKCGDIKKAGDILKSANYAYKGLQPNNLDEEGVKILCLQIVAEVFKESLAALSEDKSISNYFNLQVCLTKLERINSINPFNVRIGTDKSLKIGGLNIIKLISDLEKNYIKINEQIKNKLDGYNISEIIVDMKNRIESKNESLNDSKDIELLFNINVNNEDDKRCIEDLKIKLDQARLNALQKYNRQEDIKNSIKILLGNKYKDILVDDNSSKYLKELKSTYNDYEELLKDVKMIYKFYTLNNSKDFDEYCNNILLLHLEELHNLTSYLREYVARKIYNKKRNFYTVEDVKCTIEQLLTNLNIKNNSNSIPIA